MLFCDPVRPGGRPGGQATVLLVAAHRSPASHRDRPDAGPTRIEVGLWLADISRIDSAAQTITANLSITLSWKDRRLAHGQPGVKQFNLKDVWNPNWLIANAASNLEPTFPEIVEVAGDGTVNYRQRLIGTFSQPLDLRAFPFDDASFRIRLVSLGHSPDEMMSWTVFWIDHSLGNSQISVAVTSMLTLIAYRFSIGNEVPRLPYLTDLDALILVGTAMVFLALIEVVTTTALGVNGRPALARTIDRRCRVLFPVVFTALAAAILFR